MYLRFDNRVAIVTGAGGGLGRTYALELAKRGCKVVGYTFFRESPHLVVAIAVNDLGGDIHGSPGSTSMADKVVGEIKAAGGQAIANYNSVEDGDTIVKTAIDTWGRIDIVINNAGIVRGISFINMKEVDWDLIFKVHVKGAYAVTKAAWPYMRDQKYGRVLVTSSNAAVYGIYSAVNYSAAKHALIGFSNSLALEGAKSNIISNTLIPTAGSRLTKPIMNDQMIEALKPEYVTPLALFMVHDSFKESGQVFEAGAQWYGTMKYYLSQGKVIENATVESIRDNWNDITSMDKARHVASTQDRVSELLAAVNLKGSISPQKPKGVASGEFPSSIQSSAIFQGIADMVKKDPSAFIKLKQTFTYVVTDDTAKTLGKYTIDLKSSPPSVYFGECKNGAADVTATVRDQIFMDLAAGKENFELAIMSGKIKVKGQVARLRDLHAIIDGKKKAKI